MGEGGILDSERGLLPGDEGGKKRGGMGAVRSKKGKGGGRMATDNLLPQIYHPGGKMSLRRESSRPEPSQQAR